MNKKLQAIVLLQTKRVTKVRHENVHHRIGDIREHFSLISDASDFYMLPLKI